MTYDTQYRKIDAAVLEGIGIVGKSNLLVHPKWGPRIRLRSLLLAGDFEPTKSLHGFAPCETCKVFCQKACPAKAFAQGKYKHSNCRRQITDDYTNKVPEGEIKENGERGLIVKYCRACELACPVGT